jgi:DNA-binding NarL/FixJ family response regulator
MTKRVSPAKMLEILPLIADGHTNAQIGRALHLTEGTVKERASALYENLGARDRAHAVSIGYQRGLLKVAR